MSKLRQALSVFGVALIALTLNGCTEKVDLEELLRTEGGDWKIVNHCTVGDFPSSRVEFDRDGGGQVWLNRTCEVGYDCDNYLHFFWELDEDNERVTITWRNGFQAMMVCGDPQDQSTFIYPEMETFNFDAETEQIVVWGYTWERR